MLENTFILAGKRSLKKIFLIVTASCGLVISTQPGSAGYYE